jgi:hypothetical protein
MVRVVRRTVVDTVRVCDRTVTESSCSWWACMHAVVEQAQVNQNSPLSPWWNGSEMVASYSSPFLTTPRPENQLGSSLS